MKNLVRVILVAVVAVFVLALGSSASMAGEPSKVTLKSKKGDVAFDHAKHSKSHKIDCKTCHHAKDKSPDMKCSNCHKDKKDGNTPDLKSAMHETCIGCHKKEVKKNPASKAPKACNACHKK